MARILLPIAAVLFTWAAQAQIISPSVVNSSGGEIQDATVFVEWSLGEPAIATISNAQHILTQGFLQPNLEITGVDDPLFQEEITVYPNPFSSHLYFQTSSTRIVSLLVRDLLGRQLHSHWRRLHRVLTTRASRVWPTATSFPSRILPSG